MGSEMPLFGNKDTKYKHAAQQLAEGHIDDAIDLLEGILKDKPDHRNALVTLAVALLEVQDELDNNDERTKRAFDFLEKAISLNPKDPVPIFNRAVCKRKLGLLKDALADFKRVLELEDRHTLSLLHMAEINYELENWKEAVDLARLALIRDPAIEDALYWVKDAMIKGGMMENDLNIAKEKLPQREATSDSD